MSGCLTKGQGNQEMQSPVEFMKRREGEGTERFRFGSHAVVVRKLPYRDDVTVACRGFGYPFAFPFAWLSSCSRGCEFGSALMRSSGFPFGIRCSRRRSAKPVAVDSSLGSEARSPSELYPDDLTRWQPSD